MKTLSMTRSVHRWTGLVFMTMAMMVSAQTKKSMTVTDMMKFREIHHADISENGQWIVFTAKPDRGDGEVIVQSVDKKRSYTIPRGSKPLFSRDAKWVAAEVLPEAIKMENADKKDKPKKGLAILNTSSGEMTSFERVEKFAFSEDAQWIAWKYFEPKPEKKEKKKDKETNEDGSAGGQDEKTKKKDKPGTELTLFNLGDQKSTKIEFVEDFAFDSLSHFLAFAWDDTTEVNGLYALDLRDASLPKSTVDERKFGTYGDLSWNNKHDYLAYLVWTANPDENPTDAAIHVWDPAESKNIIKLDGPTVKADWFIPSKNDLIWTKDSDRLFFGLKPETERWDSDKKDDDDKDKEVDPLDVNAILEKREVDVWHWNDPLINSNQKKEWNQHKDRTFRAVYHLASKKAVPLADLDMPTVNVPQNTNWALGTSSVPYLKLRTWDGSFSDIYLVDITDGSRTLIAKKLEERASHSPGGRYVVYYRDKHWHLFDSQSQSHRNLTDELDVPFYDEDHDYPSDVPGYRVAGWLAGDKAVLINDKFDIWQFPVDGGSPVCITGGQGRQDNYTFRIEWLNRDQRFFEGDEKLLLTGYHHWNKQTGFYACQLGIVGVTKLVEEEKKYEIVAKAKNSNNIIFTRESYTEFPDIWVSDVSFKKRKKLTDVNPQVKEFAWGEAELVDWLSVDGTPLQGILIKPGNYEKGKRYPVLVYYYRFYSQRLHEFNQIVVNHRPCFPFYASNGYAVFLPDIRFEVGRPGFSATKCLVPGVQKIIDMGVADPKAVALHGHSWSGYQTAFVVTQTDIFNCCVSGAPVSNMTSAYGGIRWGTGLSRQFQYEKTQSRIGGTLWEARDLYIDNSPLFFVDRINTPMLIMFGDDDGAVPWTQGIELYMAMRRLEKDCVFLQYRGEPHHPQKYPNKLDYTLKMMEYLDHYCKGTPAPKWISEGVLYRGK